MFDQDPLWLAPYAIDPAPEGEDNLFRGLDEAETGGEDGAGFTVYDLADPEAPPAHVAEFDPARDTLHIQYAAATAPSLAIAHDAAAALTVVSLNGVPVATLDGDPGIGAADITLSEMI